MNFFNKKSYLLTGVWALPYFVYMNFRSIFPDHFRPTMGVLKVTTEVEDVPPTGAGPTRVDWMLPSWRVWPNMRKHPSFDGPVCRNPGWKKRGETDFSGVDGGMKLRGGWSFGWLMLLFFGVLGLFNQKKEENQNPETELDSFFWNCPPGILTYPPPKACLKMIFLFSFPGG